MADGYMRADEIRSRSLDCFARQGHSVRPSSTLVREVGAIVGGEGGGKPHTAQASVSDPSRLWEALGRGPELVRPLPAAGAAS